MKATRLPNGNLLVPMRAESDDGTLVGHGMVEIGPEHPEYAAWAERAVEEQPTGALPPHCGHVILDDEGRQVDYWPKLGQQEER